MSKAIKAKKRKVQKNGCITWEKERWMLGSKFKGLTVDVTPGESGGLVVVCEGVTFNDAVKMGGKPKSSASTVSAPTIEDLLAGMADGVSVHVRHELEAKGLSMVEYFAALAKQDFQAHKVGIGLVDAVSLETSLRAFRAVYYWVVARPGRGLGKVWLFVSLKRWRLSRRV